MTDDETPPTSGTDVAVAEPPVPGASPAELAAARRREEVRTRLWIPLLLPLGAVVTVALFVLNISRMYLSGPGTPAVVVATLITVAILLGAALISAMPWLRTSSLVLTVAGIVVLVMAGGLVTLGPSEGEEETEAGYVQPEGDPVAVLNVSALPTLRFEADLASVPAGILQINLIDEGGTHTFLFTDAELAGFELEVPPDSSGKVELSPGDFEYYCSIPGHREAGMEGALTVTEAPAAPPAPPAPGAEPAAPGGEPVTADDTAE